MVAGMTTWSLKVAKSNPITSPSTQILKSAWGSASGPAIGALKPISIGPPVCPHLERKHGTLMLFRRRHGSVWGRGSSRLVDHSAGARIKPGKQRVQERRQTLVMRDGTGKCAHGIGKT